MNSLAIESITTQKNHGYEAPLSAVSTAGQYKIEQNSVDGLVYITMDGAAWTLIATGVPGIGGTLNDAYHFAPAATPITVDSGAVSLVGAQTSGNTLQITHPAVIAAGTINGLSVDMSGVTPGAQLVQAVSIVGPATTKAKVFQTGLVSIQNRASAYSTLMMTVRNTSALSGSLVFLGWDTTNFAGAVANSVLAAQTHMVTLDGQSNVTAGANEFVCLRMLVPASSSATTSAIVIGTLQTRGVGVNLSATGTFAGGSFTGFQVDGTSGTATTEAFVGYLAAIPATSSALTIGYSVRTLQTAGAMFQGTYNAATTLSGTVRGINLDLSTNVTVPGAFYVNGATFTIPATTRANTSGEAALVINSAAISQQVMTMTCGNTSGDVVSMGWSGGQTLIGSITAMGISPNGLTVVGNNQRFWSYYTSLGRGSSIAVSPDSSCFVGAFFGTTTTRGVFFAGTDGNTHTTSGTYVCYRAAFDGALTLGGALDGAVYNFVSNVIAANQIISGIQVYIANGASTASRAAYFGYSNLAGTASGNGIVNVSAGMNGTTTGALTLLEISSDDATLTIGGGTTLTGCNIDLNANVAGNTTGIVNGLVVTMPTATASSSFAAKFDFRGLSGTAAGNGIANIVTNVSGTTTGVLTFLEIGSDTATLTLGAFAHTGINVNLATNVAGNTTGIARGLVVTMPSAVANTSYAATFDWRAALGTVAGNGIVNIEVGAATSLTGQLVGLECDLITNVTGGSQAICAARLQTAATSRVSTAGEGALVIDSRATAARVIDCAVRNTSQAVGLWQLRYGASTTLAGTTTGFVINLATNVTAGNQTVTGMTMSIPAAGSSGSNFRYGISIDRSGTISTGSNTTGSLVGVANLPTGAAGATTEAMNLFEVLHIVTGGAGTIADTTTGFHVSMNPATASAVVGIFVEMSSNATGAAATFTHSGTALATAAVGITTVSTNAGAIGLSVTSTPGAGTACTVAQFTAAANVTGPCVSITHSGNGGTANQDHIVFTAVVDGASAHLRGPVAGTFVLKAGIRSGAGAGRDVSISSGDGVTAGVGGAISLLEGAGAGGSARGTITIGSAATAILSFYATNAGAVQAAAIADITGGAVPQTAAGATNCMDKINLILAALRGVALIAT